MIRRSLRWVFLITGTTIGAGYASGREIWQFFGDGAGLGIIIFTVLFILSIHTILMIGYHHKSKHYLIVLEKIAGKKFSLVYDYMILIYLFLITAVMIAGSGATFSGFSLPFWWGILFIVIVLLILFKRDINEAIVINERIMPFLIIGIFLVLLSYIIEKHIPVTNHLAVNTKWLAAFPFTALNILPIIAVLGAVGHKIQSKGEIYLASVISGLLLGTLTFMYNMSLVYANSVQALKEIPLYSLLADYPTMITILMAIALWLAILTTAAANLFGIITRIRDKLPISEGRAVFLILLLLIPFSSFGFANLVSFIYPLYGILNIYLLVQIILYSFSHKENR